ncbi:hypothetical protein [Streptomyces apocyni]|uniref:hypothetical protein n=1 Tax=Streptomyces apocyni TaxID=2654677 RepID=UPI0012EAF8DD|nr:hypothetical protein [Streptomyces apocyni]
MSPPDRKEVQIRRILDGPPPAVPPRMYADAVRRGGRLLRRRRWTRRLAWVLFTLALLALVIWASLEQPWVVPPSETTPPLTGW